MNLNYFKDRVVATLAIPFTIVVSMNYGTTDHDLYTIMVTFWLKMKITNSLFIDQN